MDQNLQLLQDKLAIMQVQYNYARGVDTRDKALLRSTYADTIVYDFRGHDPSLYAENVPADDWVEGTFAMIKGLRATEHQMTNFLIEVDGDTAEAVVYLRAMHYLPNEFGESCCECGGYYKNGYVRTPEGWKIKKVNLNYLWWTGNQHVFKLAAQ